MGRLDFGGKAALLFGIALSVACGTVPTGAQAKTVKSPDWFLQGSAPPDDLARADAITRAADPRDPLTACAGDIPKLCPDLPRPGQRSCLAKQSAKLSGQCREALASAPPPSSLGVPPCVDSTVCSPASARGTRNDLQRVEWKQTMGYKFAYPFALPPGGDGVLGVAFDRDGNFWAYQRSPAGRPTLFKFDRSGGGNSVAFLHHKAARAPVLRKDFADRMGPCREAGVEISDAVRKKELARRRPPRSEQLKSQIRELRPRTETFVPDPNPTEMQIELMDAGSG